MSDMRSETRRMAENRERLVSDILLDIAGHEEMLEFSRRKAQDGRGIAAYWEAHVCSHAAILRDLHKELSERTGEPTDYEPNVGELGIALVWHPKTERPDDESQILIDEGDGCGTAGTCWPLPPVASPPTGRTGAWTAGRISATLCQRKKRRTAYERNHHRHIPADG